MLQGVEEALHSTSLTHTTVPSAPLEDAESQKSKVNLKGNKTNGLKYTPLVCGLYSWGGNQLKET